VTRLVVGGHQASELQTIPWVLLPQASTAHFFLTYVQLRTKHPRAATVTTKISISQLRGVASVGSGNGHAVTIRVSPMSEHQSLLHSVQCTYVPNYHMNRPPVDCHDSRRFTPPSHHGGTGNIRDQTTSHMI
jgi:hypothetical protein